jgi:hypothetical protein
MQKIISRMKKLLLFVTAIFFASCSSEKGIDVKVTHVKGQNKQERDSVITEGFFEVQLKSITKDGHKIFIAEKDIIKPVSGKEFEAKYITISDGKRTDFVFNDKASLLSYMSERGFNVVNQTENKYGGNFIFQKD